ncbi:MAG: hypothetical protein JRJ86_11585 [Deltaproteobacteria bacterium]|nr:hypothetical protein [Deltaproteobacteria bacterium]MBW2117270.1 hypothetical protein [Deltaproteobacteria bacterium]MBW2345235.1 hypothetical protein [Deltaproteobacteria bacterium]
MAGMLRLGAPAEIVAKMFEKAPVILKGGLTLGGARRYADAVQDAGGRVIIQEHGHFEESGRLSASISIAPFQEFTMCPECGLKQPKGEACERCGFRFGNKK